MASVLDFSVNLLICVAWLLVDFAKKIIQFVYHPAKSLENEVILITGAASGIGRLMAYRFAERNPKMIICWDMNEAENIKTAEEIKRKNPGVKTMTYKVDLSDRDATYSTSTKTKQDLKKVLGEKAYVTMLINNAGIVTGRKMTDCPDKLIQLTMDVNTTAHFWTLKAFLPAMKSANHGHIVTIASTAGMFGVAGLSDYCASKYGALGLTESLKMELHKENLNVECTVVCPYFISTGMFEGVKSKYEWFLPIVKPTDMVDRIVSGVVRNEYMILYPRTVWILRMLKPFMPIESYLRMSARMGINEAMDEFVGRKRE